ncbi:hypothetical protein DH2020_045462 [Rehmannia glutinosa]|uniref:BHLH domain-containing protein n=1 Tax=Rehmannia glutinosa TaxID=99300 RepID=A0ABR0UE41_REHGL
MSRSSGFLFSNPTHHKNVSTDGEFLKSREFNGSDLFQNNQQQNPGLARYRSAPSSFLAALLDSNTDNNSNSSSGDESEAFFSALIDGPRDLNQNMKQEVGVETGARPGFLNGQMGGYESVVNGGGGAIVGSYSVGVMESPVHGTSLRFGVMGEIGNYKVQNHTESSPSATGLNNHINFSSAPSSSSRFMPSIPENVNESIPTISPENGRLRNGNESHFNGLKRNRDGDLKMFSNFNGLENQNGETRKKGTGLVSHLSLPKTSAEMAVVENFLQFQQETTVPCQIRAKRGFATHPRSIAERMRRTRISDNMKKLQDLFPNMDKQTNTADMLDLAVEYIKDLQKQVQTLTDTRANAFLRELHGHGSIDARNGGAVNKNTETRLSKSFDRSTASLTWRNGAKGSHSCPARYELNEGREKRASTGMAFAFLHQSSHYQHKH